MKIDLHNYEAFLLDYFEGRLEERDADALRLFVMEHPELEIDLNDADLFSLPLADDSPVFEFKNSLKKNTPVSENELAFEYVEGQLSSEDRQLFEIRLQNDPLLAEALAAYQNTILKPEVILYPDQKDEFYKMAGDAALAFHYAEHTLSASEKEATEKYIATNELLRSQIEAYRKTILTPDPTITYPDKSTLKRKEARIVHLFSLRMISGLAAGVVLVAGLYSLITGNSPESGKKNLQAKTNNILPSDPGTTTQQVAGLPEQNSKTKEKGKVKVKNSVIRQLNKNEMDNSGIAVTAPETSRTKDKQKVKIKNSIIRQLNKDTTDQSMLAITKDKSKTKIKNSIIRQLQKDTVSAEATHLAQADKTPQNTFPGNVKNSTDHPVPSTKPGEKTERITLIPTGTDTEEDILASTASNKKRSLWSKALSAAGQLNNLGLKSVNGNSGENGDVLSLSNVSVELKKSK